MQRAMYSGVFLHYADHIFRFCPLTFDIHLTFACPALAGTPLVGSDGGSFGI